MRAGMMVAAVLAIAPGAWAQQQAVERAFVSEAAGVLAQVKLVGVADEHHGHVLAGLRTGDGAYHSLVPIFTIRLDDVKYMGVARQTLLPGSTRPALVFQVMMGNKANGYGPFLDGCRKPQAIPFLAMETTADAIFGANAAPKLYLMSEWFDAGTAVWTPCRTISLSPAP